MARLIGNDSVSPNFGENFLRLRESSGRFFGKNQLAILDDFKHTATGRNHLRVYAIFLFYCFG